MPPRELKEHDDLLAQLQVLVDDRNTLSHQTNTPAQETDAQHGLTTLSATAQHQQQQASGLAAANPSYTAERLQGHLE